MSKTALFLFIRDPEQEARIKPLAGNHAKGQNRQVFHALNHHIIRSIKATGLPWYIINGKEQEGTSFGEKFTNAFRQVFAKGYERVIALGNDHPDLQPDVILRAAGLLDQHSHVVGPAKDGGLYLTGIQQQAFDGHVFQNLPWQTSALLDAYTRQMGVDHSSFATLPVLQDADNTYQFKQLLHRLKGTFPHHNLVSRLMSLLGFSPLKRPIFRLNPLSPILFTVFSLRGPPANALIAFKKAAD